MYPGAPNGLGGYPASESREGRGTADQSHVISVLEQREELIGGASLIDKFEASGHQMSIALERLEFSQKNLFFAADAAALFVGLYTFMKSLWGLSFTGLMLSSFLT